MPVPEAVRGQAWTWFAPGAAGRTVLGVVLLAAAPPAELPAQPSGTFVDTVDVEVVEVDVVVTDRKGRPVRGLTRDDFELYVDGQETEISNFLESGFMDGPIEEPVDEGGQAGPTNRGTEPDKLPAAPQKAALTVAIYLDDLHLYPPHRNRLLGRLEAALEPWRSTNASWLLVRFENRVEVVVPPTRDLDAILAGAAAAPKGRPRAVMHALARRQAIGRMKTSNKVAPLPCHSNWGELMAIAREHSAKAETQVAVAADGLADMISALGGLPGRKALIHVTDGLPQRPGIAVWSYLGNELCVDDRPSAPREVAAEIVQYNEYNRFHHVSAHANANRVTLFTVDAAGVREPGMQGISARNDHLHAMNAQSGLHILADETGGKALFNSNDLAVLLGDMTAQLAASYSLGFVPAERTVGRVRKISVVLAPDAQKRRKVQFRRSYREKGLDERLAERLLSAAWLDTTANPLDARVGFTATVPREEELHELTVAVTAPVESIVVVPRDREGRSASGEVRLWLVAVDQESGARTSVRQKSLPVGGRDGTAAIDGAYRFEVAMRLPAGEYQVAVGFRDETTAVTSLLRESVTVPTAAVATAAD